MKKYSKSSVKYFTGISNLKLLSSEIEFDSKDTYTIICGSKNKGLEGEGEFELKVFTTDHSMELTYYKQYPEQQPWQKDQD